MALAPAILGHVQVPDSKGDLLAPGAGHIYQVHLILIHNINTSTENVVLYIDDGTNERIAYNMDVAANDTIQIEFRGEGLPLDGDSSQKITGVTDTASKVNVTFTGSDRT